MKPHAFCVLALSTCLVSAAGCSVPQQPAAPTPSNPLLTSSTTTQPVHDSHATEAGIDTTAVPKAVGSVVVACAPGHRFASVRIDVLEVERRDKLALARFVAVAQPRSDRPVEEAPTSLYRCNGAAWDPALIDGQNLLGYRPIQLAVSDPLRTQATNLELSELPTYLFAVFPAPEAGVTTIDVVVGAGSVSAVPVK